VLDISSEYFALLPPIKKVNIKVYKTVVGMWFCMGERIMPFTSREVYRLKRFASRVPKTVFGAKGEDGTGDEEVA
jgi:hypothetical protein